MNIIKIDRDIVKIYLLKMVSSLNYLFVNYLFIKTLQWKGINGSFLGRHHMHGLDRHVDGWITPVGPAWSRQKLIVGLSQKAEEIQSRNVLIEAPLKKKVLKLQIELWTLDTTPVS